MGFGTHIMDIILNRNLVSCYFLDKESLGFKTYGECNIGRQHLHKYTLGQKANFTPFYGKIKVLQITFLYLPPFYRVSERSKTIFWVDYFQTALRYWL